MTNFATALLTLAASTWVGAIIFQSAVVAPAVFVDLDEPAARRFLRTLFPRFYRLGLVCGALMIAGLVWLGALTDAHSNLFTLAIVTFVMIVLEVASLGLVPRINAARDAGEAGHATFSRLHRISVLLTVVILLLGIGVLAAIAAMAARGL